MHEKQPTRIGSGLRRFIHIVRVVIKHFVAHKMHQRLAQWPRFAHWLLGKPLSGPDRLRVAFEEIGGTLIKLGQMLALQSDMLPLEYCRGLFSLFDKVPPFAYEYVERTFLEDLKQTPQQVFDSFDIRPFATGSIGQVHIATLGAHKLAVKVRRPTILQDFAVDITSLMFIVKTVKLFRIRKLYWIVGPTEEFVAWTREELDYRREAHYMDELGRNARDNPYEKIPTVFWHCTTARILTVDFLDGLTLSDFLRNKEKGDSGASPDFDPDLFAVRLIDNFLGDAFDHGMFHADLHPGNIMILPGNVVGYIDFGISGVLSRYSRRHLSAETLGIARGDLDDMVDSFFLVSTFAENANRASFRQQLKERAANWYGGDGRGTLSITITTLMLELLTLSRESGIWPQRDVIKYIRSAIALDGLIRTFSPNVNVGARLAMICEQKMRRDGLRNLISSEAIDASLGGYAHLFHDGMLRLFRSLRQAISENPEEQYRFNQKPPRRQASWLWHAATMTWIGFCIALVLKPSQAAAVGGAMYALRSAALSIIIWGTMKVARLV